MRIDSMLCSDLKMDVAKTDDRDKAMRARMRSLQVARPLNVTHIAQQVTRQLLHIARHTSLGH
jgi:hypothetical protein